MTNIRILVTGSREWTDKDRIWEALMEAERNFRPFARNAITIVHGDNPRGADRLADVLGNENGFVVERDRKSVV